MIKAKEQEQWERRNSLVSKKSKTFQQISLLFHVIYSYIQNIYVYIMSISI